MGSAHTTVDQDLPRELASGIAVCPLVKSCCFQSCWCLSMLSRNCWLECKEVEIRSQGRKRMALSWKQHELQQISIQLQQIFVRLKQIFIELIPKHHPSFRLAPVGNLHFVGCQMPVNLSKKGHFSSKEDCFWEEMRNSLPEVSYGICWQSQQNQQVFGTGIYLLWRYYGTLF